MGFFCKIFVDDRVIYAGDLTEVPEEFREDIREAISEWAGSLDKRGLNELVYSLFAWYDKKGMYCESCNVWYEEDSTVCPVCRADLISRYIYERNRNLDLILTCVGMISKIEVLG
ncbi:MAG: hypothetical protein KatS3mg078_0358 [Deltaproteobacteria bacterium]|jgi:hypothetical protein|nr:MAG: hypothetical protein KatS3mg078_0358 [Deltaproteobacteria bacterium]